MSPEAQFSDEDITSFLDGEADAEMRAAIEALANTDPAFADRLGAMDAARDDIVHAFEDLMPTAPAMPALPEPAARTAPRWGFGTGALTGLAAGLAVAVIGQALLRPAPPSAPKMGWIEAVANYQILYNAETLADVAQSAETTRTQLQQLSDRLGRDLSDLPLVTTGMTFKRGQLLGFNEKPLVQLAYLSDSGTPVALCILPSGKPASAPKVSEVRGMAAVSWVENGHGFLLIGGQDSAALQSAATDFRTHL